jgi:RNA polymerase sigma factor (sigma-70 family)
MPSARGPRSSWEQLAEHRDVLLQTARRHAPSAEAAEDAVQEALARAAAHWDTLDQARLGAWLNAVTLRICADQHRERSTERRHLPRLLPASIAVDPGDLVSERLEDAWLVQKVRELPARHREVLHAIAEQGTVPAAAHSLGMSRQATESLLKRARAVMRSRLAATLAAFGVLRIRRLRPWRSATTATGLAVVSAALLTLLPQVAPWRLPSHDGATRPARGHAGDGAARPAAPSGASRHGQPSSAGGSRQAGQATSADRPVMLLPPHRFKAGPVEQNDGGKGVVVKHPGDGPVKSVRACLRDGVEVSTTYIGCKASKT